MSERWALVIGGSGALGGGICHSLAEDGWNIALTYRSGAAAAAANVDAIATHGRSAVAIALDLSDPDGVEASLQGFLGKHELGAVVYAAGPHTPQRYISELDWTHVQEVLLQDVVGPFAAVVACLPALRRTRGAVVALTTTAVERYAKRDFLSAAPKAALQTLIRGLAVEEGRFGVRANCVAVGIIEAGLYEELVARGDISGPAIEAITADIPLPRLGAIEDVTEAVRYLVSHRAGFVSGETIHVDGGRSV